MNSLTISCVPSSLTVVQSSAAGNWRWLLLAGVMALAACSTQRLEQPAPVEDRVEVRVPPRLPPGAENAGKPGYYTVRQGDTLFRIALDNGQTWRELQAWNNLSNPNLLEVGQVLRVVPPPAGAMADASSGAASPGIPAAPVVVAVPTPTTTPPITPSPSPVSPAAAAPGAAPAAPQAAVSAPTAAAAAPVAAATAAAASPALVARPLAPVSPNAASSGAASAADAVNWAWPAQGSVVTNFDEASYKGIAIAGRMGDPVLAAADGRVVYAGAGLRGYGNLIILKHNNTYLTAYAHNQSLLVREDQFVKQGQKIAEMGSSDTDRVKLHFEVRRQGKPVDPLTHLPKR